MTLFGPIRKNALEYWAEQTGRTILDENDEYLLTDTFEGAYECDWQFRYKPGHVNLFCSLGDWACNLTDLLKDDRYDGLDLDDEEQAIVVFRFYTRLMLVISELLTDFQDIYLQTRNLNLRSNKNVARSFYFPNENPDRLTRILEYINHACKHKTQHLHICNNHLPIIFQDSTKRRKRYNYISLDNSSATGKNGILVPNLLYLMKSVLVCYRKLNAYFRDHRAEFIALCVRYS